MYRGYVKKPHLNEIISNDGIPCEQKLEQIKLLAEGKKLSVLPSGETPILVDNDPKGGVQNVEEITQQSGMPTHFDNILSKITGIKEKKLAQVILEEIEKSPYMSYDVNSSELIIRNETIKYTNVAELIKFVVGVNPSSLPIGLTIFVHSLLKIKAPFNVVRAGDAINCRENLIQIEQMSGNESVEQVEVSAGNEENPNEKIGIVESNVTESIESEMNQKKTGVKRSREEDDEPETEAKRKFGVEEKSLENIRRSPRLRERISEVWTSNAGTKKKGNKK